MTCGNENVNYKTYQPLYFNYISEYTIVRNTKVIFNVSPKALYLYRCSRPSGVGCSLGCLLVPGAFPQTGQHAVALPVRLCVHMLLPGGLVFALYSHGSECWLGAAVKLLHILNDRSPTENTEGFIND